MTDRPNPTILDTEQAARAWQTIEELAAALASYELAPREVSSAVLFWSYAVGASERDDWDRQFDRALDQLATELEKPVGDISIVGGAANLGFVAEHVTGGEGLEVCDQFLLELLEQDPWPGHFDHLSGLAGLGVYFLERLLGDAERHAARAGIEKVLDHLDSMSESIGSVTTWLTPRRLLTGRAFDHFTDGYYNLGTAHGVPGVIAFLGRCAAERDNTRARSMLERAVAWLLAQQRPGDGRRFGASISPTGEIDPIRSVWCYGDAGAAFCLLGAAVRNRRDDWVSAATDTLLAAARDGDPDGRVVDAPVCHGAAGLAHIFARAAKITREPELRLAAQDWFRRLFDMREDMAGLAAFPILRPAHNGREERWETSASWLEGAVGVGLVLLSALTGETGWDHLLCG